MKRSIQIILAICIVILTPVSTWATVDNEARYEIATNEITNWPKGPDILADTGVLMETETAEVLYDKGMNEKRYPASITKILTALLALENSSPEDEVVFSARSLEGMYEGTNVGMQEGEILTMDQCLKIMMIRSANEVANQIAETVGGTREEFSNMMNARAAEIGCENTHFTNPSGMPDDNHYTTAYDMALIFREALNNEQFRELIGTVDFFIEPTNRNAEQRYVHSNHHLFVSTVPQHYEGVIGGKTGNTQIGGSSLVTGVERDGTNFIAVVMKTEDHLFCCEDTTKLFDYGYNEFEKIDAEEGNLLTPKNGTEDDLQVEEKDLSDNMVEKTYSYNGYLLGTIVGEALDSPDESNGATEEDLDNPDEEDNVGAALDQPAQDQPDTSSGIPMSLLMRRIIVVMSGVILLGLILIIILAIRKKIKK